MRRGLPLLLVLVGGALVTIGILLAAKRLSDLYQGATTDALNQPEGTEAAVSRDMKRAALLAAPGAVVMLIGKVMMARRRRAARRQSSAQG